MTNRIRIAASSPRVTTIDIEGIIGTPEEWQFSESISGEDGSGSPGSPEKVATYARRGAT